MLTIQATPNLSVHMPNESPQGAFSSGTPTVPSPDRASQQPRSLSSSSPESVRVPFGLASMPGGTSAAMRVMSDPTSNMECMTLSFSDSGSPIPGVSPNVETVSSPPNTER